VRLEIPELFREVIEETAIQARGSEFVDQSSGVSVRLTITLLENLASNLERRGLATGDTRVYARLVDLRTALSAVTGKIELVYEGEQEGAETVARHVLGKAVRRVFLDRFPEVHTRGRRRLPRDPLEDPDEERPRAEAPPTSPAVYQAIVQWFSSGNTLDLSDDTPFDEHLASLKAVTGLEECVRTHVNVSTAGELAGVMELVLDRLHQCSLLSKQDADTGVGYRDMIGAMFQQMEGIE